MKAWEKPDPIFLSRFINEDWKSRAAQEWNERAEKIEIDNNDAH